MTIRVQANHKYIDEIQSVAQIFFPHARFGSEETPVYTLISAIENNQAHAEIIANGAPTLIQELKNECNDVVAKSSPIRQHKCAEEQSNEAIQEFHMHKQPWVDSATPQRFYVDGTTEFEKSTNIKQLGTYSLILSDLPLPEKRQAMLAMYRLLQSTIGAFAPWGALTGVRPTKMVREWMANGQTETEIQNTLQTIFHVSKSRANLAIQVAQAENRLSKQITPSKSKPPSSEGGGLQGRGLAFKNTGESLGLYVSIPFCPSRCVYCSFNTASGPWNEQSQTQYITAVISELSQLQTTLNETSSKITSIYIGGGTPTALKDHLLETLLSKIQELTTSTEYTIEAGRPDTITPSNLKIMRKYNVNRISINPQTQNNETLKKIGRNHTTQDFKRAFHEAREAGFTTINTDIIAGLPGEGPKDMHHTMETLATLAPENITIHTLAVKRASKLNEHRTENALAPYALPCESAIESQLKIAHEAAVSLGHIPYYLYRQKNMAALFENTGYSLPGHECLYNIGMMSEVQTVLGIGAGAVSKYIEGNKITRKFNVKNPEIYIQRMQEREKYEKEGPQ